MRAALLLFAAGCSISSTKFIEPAEPDAEVRPDGAPGTVRFVVSETSLAFAEGAAAKTFTVFLEATAPLPTDDVIVMIGASNAAATAMPNLMLFPVADLATPQTVTVNATTDADFDMASSSIDLTSSRVADAAHVAVNVIEPGILLLGTTSGIACPNDPVATTLRLRGDPKGTVVVSITRTPPATSMASPLMMTFDSTTFATPQNISMFSTANAAGTATYDFVVAAQPLITAPRYTLTVRSPGTPICNL